MSSDDRKQQSQGNEGEGSRTADRHYRQGVKHHLETHDIDEEARRAAKAVESEENEDLQAAEKAGKKRAKEFEPS